MLAHLNNKQAVCAASSIYVESGFSLEMDSRTEVHVVWLGPPPCKNIKLFSELMNSNPRLFITLPLGDSQFYEKSILTKYTLILIVLLAVLVAKSSLATELTIASVRNGQMERMEALTRFFEASHPDIKLKWKMMDEQMLRDKVSADVAAGTGQYDIATIGMYEAPIWAKKKWIRPLEFNAAYQEGDLVPAMRSGLSYKGKIYAAPFYGESSMLAVRTDLLKHAGIKLDERPTWHQVRDVAARLNDPSNGVYGICLRGRAGWGDNVALISTMVNAFGGQWFDLNWKPQIDSPEWKAAVHLYIDLLNNFGPPRSENYSFNEILGLYKAGKCGMWLDSTIAASFLADPKQSNVAADVDFVQAPFEITKKGTNWLWAWALAIPADTHKTEAAQKFVSWATSREYIQLVAKQYGWSSVPTGTRKSTYLSRDFRRSSRWAKEEQKAIFAAYPDDQTLPSSPYIGIQFAAIPEFADIGNIVGKYISMALAGKLSIDEALRLSQAAAEDKMRAAGYYHSTTP